MDHPLVQTVIVELSRGLAFSLVLVSSNIPKAAPIVQVTELSQDRWFNQQFFWGLFLGLIVGHLGFRRVVEAIIHWYHRLAGFSLKDSLSLEATGSELSPAAKALSKKRIRDGL